MRSKTVAVDTHKLYQFLIDTCRYAYTRNNHLMPSCAYDDAKKYLQKMFVVDSNMAIHTAEQLCEECISFELMDKFYYKDDEFGNKKLSIDFVKYLIEWIHKNSDVSYVPYNYDDFIEMLEKD